VNGLFEAFCSIQTSHEQQIRLLSRDVLFEKIITPRKRLSGVFQISRAA
jgi:hypothetical protein